VIPDPKQPSEKRGSGLLGVLAGFALVFILVAILSFIRIVVPRHVHFGSVFPPPVEHKAVHIDSEEQRLLRAREARWQFEGARHPPFSFERRACR